MKLPYCITAEQMKDFTWSAKRELPSPDDRTKNDPCYLMSSKKTFDLVRNLASHAINSEDISDDMVIPTDIFQNSGLSEFVLEKTRKVARDIGWSAVHNYNGQYFFISELYKPAVLPTVVTKTVIIEAKPPHSEFFNICERILNLEGSRYVAGVKIIGAQTLIKDLMITTSNTNARYQDIANEICTIAEFNQETGILILSPATEVLLILTVEYKIAG